MNNERDNRRLREDEDDMNSLNRFIDNFIQSHDAAPPIVETGNPYWLIHDTNVPPSLLASTRNNIPSLLGNVPFASLHGQIGPAQQQAELHHNLQYTAQLNALYSGVSFPPPASVLPPVLMPSAATTAAPLYTPSRAITLSSHSTASNTSRSVSTFTTANVYLPRDEESLSPYQCLLRQQLEFFESTNEDASVVQGRNKPVSLYQVGLRCRHCARVNVVQRTAGATYYPTRLDSIYQSGQNVAKHHFDVQGCPTIPREIQQVMTALAHEVRGRKGKSSKGGGKLYWAETAREVGVVETSNGLIFASRR
ncbi:hypothetical protein FisN_9Hh041 [Fistulifera solaris]|uniref:Uncharacterized protein n=1 Tax=Fistulifera solaris TaxID=1519565 RepID=A0A1Z5K2E5_FISSO|nr:hypothetical protein FisN_9Hh041 [Fistulifera solaris]|eukprot:GAX20332.1 hypothetical protein FisN_9Hh041 [Fistulifera solaris]